MRKSKFNFDEFEEQVILCKEMNKENLKKEKLKRICDESFLYYNSLNVMCGPQGSGKTWTACKETAKISHVSPETHLLIIICKNENKDDPTIETLKPLINIPIEYVIEDDAEEYVKNLLKWKRFYNDVKTNHWENKLQDSQIEQLFDELQINDFNRPWLHTILLFNDIAKSKLFKRGEQYFPQIVALGRHTQCSTFLNIQFWKGIHPEIKANITTACIFGGFSRQQFVHILSQLPSHYDYQQLYPMYRQLKKKDKMIFTNGEVIINEK